MNSFFYDSNMIGNWNEVWSILEEGGKSVDVRWFLSVIAVNFLVKLLDTSIWVSSHLDAIILGLYQCCSTR